MLDSSPISISPPKTLKRTASTASLPSPPSSVEHLKKRATSQRFGTDTGSGDDEVDEAIKEPKAVGRKLLFPAAPLTSSGVDHADNPLVDNCTPSEIRGSSAPDVDSSQFVHCASASASPPLSKGKATKTPTPLSRTPSPVNQRGICSQFELPVLDEENNPFLVDGPLKLRRPRSPRDFTEPPTMTYVFKGIKISVPNPHYNLPDSAYDCSRLPLSHPDYSPLPARTPRLLFPEAYQSADDAEEDGVSSGPIERSETDLRTPDVTPRMSKLFVDDAGNPLPDSGPQGIRGATMDARDIERMALGRPIRDHDWYL